MKPAAKQDVAFAAPEPGSRERELIAVIQELVQELHPQRAKSMDVSESSRLERDLGIDSLGRTELVLRVERTFGVRLAGADARAAETVDSFAHWIRLIPRAWSRLQKHRWRLSPLCRLLSKRGR